MGPTSSSFERVDDPKLWTATALLLASRSPHPDPGRLRDSRRDRPRRMRFAAWTRPRARFCTVGSWCPQGLVAMSWPGSGDERKATRTRSRPSCSQTEAAPHPRHCPLAAQEPQAARRTIPLFPEPTALPRCRESVCRTTCRSHYAALAARIAAHGRRDRRWEVPPPSTAGRGGHGGGRARRKADPARRRLGTSCRAQAAATGPARSRRQPGQVSSGGEGGERDRRGAHHPGAGPRHGRGDGCAVHGDGATRRRGSLPSPRKGRAPPGRHRPQGRGAGVPGAPEGLPPAPRRDPSGSIKPANLFLARDGVSAASWSRFSISGSPRSKPAPGEVHVGPDAWSGACAGLRRAIMSPEASAERSGASISRTDLWSLGMVLSTTPCSGNPPHHEA